jgi:hypothetical protein
MGTIIMCYVTEITHQDKLVIFNKIANLIRSCLQNPCSEISGGGILLAFHDPNRKIAILLGRDMEWPDNWVLNIYLSNFFGAIANEKIIEVLALLKELDMRTIEPSYAKTVRQESDADPDCDTDPDWRGLGFIDETVAYKKWHPVTS